MLKPKYLITSLILIALIASYITFYKQQDTQIKQELTTMDYTNIPLAKLPQDQLFTFKQAQVLKQKAFYEGFPTVKDEQAMLELTKHAYQWDKNAMIAYAQIIEAYKTRPLDGGSITLADFLKKYSYELVDNQGNPLQTPAILNLEYKEFLKVLANKGYIEPAKILVGRASELERQIAIKYYKIIIKGGYRYNVALANTILFDGSGYINRKPIKLIDHIATITNEEIREAIESYKVASLHGNQSSMMRLAEVYYYGVGEQQDYKTALAWTKLSNETYIKMIEFYKSNPNSDFNKISSQATNQHNLDLANQIKEQLTPDEIEQANKIAEQLEQSIVTWNYREWVNSATIPTQP